MSNYRPNVARHLRDLIAELGPIGSLLDYGAGNGWMINQVLTADTEIDSATAVDVQPRAEFTVRHRVSPLPCHEGFLSVTDRVHCGVIYERVKLRS